MNKSNNLLAKLDGFRDENKVYTKGPLAIAIQLTRMAKDKKFPLNSDDFQTKGKGQVAGLGGANLKNILEEHGITKILAAEGGRTSRGGMGLMLKYVEFLNQLQAEESSIDLTTAIEEYWTEEIKKYFDSQPLVLKTDVAKTIAANINELIDEVRKREKENPGNTYLGTVLQHLVAAKLLLVMPKDKPFEIYGAAVADTSTARNGDFNINNIVIHCTTAPGDALIAKCKANLGADLHPIIITIFDRVQDALHKAEDAGIAGRVEVWDIQQFLSTNIYEHSVFNGNARNSKLAEIVGEYNKIIEEKESDQSLRIEIESK